MVESSYGVLFFLKSATTKKKNLGSRVLHVRVTVDGVKKETSLKRNWEYDRWDQAKGRASGFKEDARVINLYLDSCLSKINVYRNELFSKGISVTSQMLIDVIKGKQEKIPTYVEEFEEHNEELYKLYKVGTGAKGTWAKYTYSLNHLKSFLKFKYNTNDIRFVDLNYNFISAFDIYLRTEKKCNNNTTLKYIANVKKIVIRAIKKDYIEKDPFKNFSGKIEKVENRPHTRHELKLLENKTFTCLRLEIIRDIYVFQCYTGLCYADVKALKHDHIFIGMNNKKWILTSRTKTKSKTDVPLLDKALEIMEKYRNHPDCIKNGTVLPVRSNQKMNEYLKEIGVLCGINSRLNTHKARRTFASTVTLANGVPIHVVKEMLGHKSVAQTEEYSITQQEQINSSMETLRKKLSKEQKNKPTIESLELKLNELVNFINTKDSSIDPMAEVIKLANELNELKLQHKA